MNDRFAAELRRHLLTTADDRPAEGQLASVIHGVAGTTQRHPLIARWTWSPGPVGRAAPFAVRYGLIAAGLAVAALTGMMMAGGTSNPSTVFEGTWTAIDPADRSGMTLVVGPGQSPAVYFEDGYASGAACVKDAVKRFTARGKGQISGNGLVTTYPDGGGCGLRTVGIAGRYKYDPQSDTLSDQDGVVWNRPLREQSAGPSSDVPALTPSLEPVAPSTTPPSVHEPVDATFESTMHGLSIGHPAAWETRSASGPWTGGALGFETAGADVIFDPTYEGRLFLAIASQPYDGLSRQDWKEAGINWLCPDGVAFEDFDVGGASALVVHCGSTQAALVFTEARGYMIRLEVPSGESGLAERFDRAWFSQVLETVDLRPDDAVDTSTEPPATPAATQTVAPEETPVVGTPAPDPDPTVHPSVDGIIASPQIGS